MENDENSSMFRNFFNSDEIEAYPKCLLTPENYVHLRSEKYKFFYNGLYGRKCHFQKLI